jgi:S-adenosylmethionine:tRNA ribosyltransferase-isomerase
MHRTSDFDYDLSPGQIAQDPLPDRSASRLLVLDRASGAIRHTHFPSILDLVAPADVLVVNESRVIPARLRGKRDGGRATGTFGAPAELLLVRELPDGTWLAMVRPGGKLKPGRRVMIGDDAVVEIVAVTGGGMRQVRFVGPLGSRAVLARYGEVPLPPYIQRPPRPASATRPSMRGTTAALPRPPPGCISLPSCSRA